MSTGLQASSRYFDTIVIGAGISGLACAAQLFQQQARNGGSSSIKILEARDRIGGRIGSVYVNGCRLDTGANWIHGTGTDENPNPLMKILPHKRYRELEGSVMFRPPPRDKYFDGAEQARDPKASDDWVHIYAEREASTRQTQDLVIPAKAAEKLRTAMWSTIGQLHEIAASTAPAAAKSTALLDAIKQSSTFSDTFNDLEPEYRSTLSGIPQFVENMEAAPLVAESAEHPQEQSGVGLLEYAIDDFEGEQVFLQDGYAAVVDELAKDLVGASAIELGVEVQQISWDNDPVVLETTAGTYEAKNVICTVPLGVLKGRQQDRSARDSFHSPPSLFQPQLPQDKTDAISSLGFGTLDKIFLVYSHPWWTKEPYTSVLQQGFTHHSSNTPQTTSEPDSFMGFVSEPDSMRGFTNQLTGFAVQADGKVISGPRILSVINLYSLTGFPVLSAFVSCSNARTVEAMSDADAGKLVQTALSSWFGRETPEPEAVHVTRWAQDPLSKGSYTNMITGVSEKAHREAFQDPLVNKDGCSVRFAGEHTSSENFATVHVALLSGWREANAILSCT